MKDVNGRLASLNILKGFDLFMLLRFQPVFMQWLSIKNDPAWNGVMRQFKHTNGHILSCGCRICTSCRCISYNTLDV